MKREGECFPEKFEPITKYDIFTIRDLGSEVFRLHPEDYEEYLQQSMIPLNYLTGALSCFMEKIHRMHPNSPDDEAMIKATIKEVFGTILKNNW